MKILSVFRLFGPAIVGIFTPLSLAWAQIPPQYHIDASVDVIHKRITANQTTQWTNHDSVDVPELIFHIYPNRRFTREEENLMWRFAGYFKVNPFPDGFQTGRMHIHSVTQNGKEVPYVIEGEDLTILRIMLPERVKPHESVRVTINFSVDIPHATLGRFGWNDNVIRISRWYPILSVYNKEQGWNRNPFYAFHRPFYSEASNYTVDITFPKEYSIASSGARSESQAIQARGEDNTTVRYDADFPIRDFSFALSPDYRTTRSNLGDVEIISFYLKGHEKAGLAALENVKDVMRFYTQRFGSYPYRSLTIAPVDLGYGGEQMSNLIFIDRRAYEMPKMMNRYFDFLVAHETGHQWFYNMIGVNEYQEMWLEEGINSYFIEQYLNQKYGEEGEVIDFPKWAKKFNQWFLPKLTFKSTRDTRYKSIARIGMDHAIISRLSSFSEPSAIFSVTYGKGARVLGMLKYYVGDEAFARIFQRIFSEFKFKNLTVVDFIRLSENESGMDLGSFFDQWLYGDQQFNYAISEVGRNTVTLQNKGGISIPAQVEVKYQDGATESFIWKGSPQKETITLTKNAAVQNVAIDPQSQLLDIDRVNNHWPRRFYKKLIPLYSGVYELPAVLPDDGYSIIAGPELANNGVGVKASIQKPYEQILYVASDFEFGEQLHHSRAGYQLKNIFQTQTAMGFEIANTTDYDDGGDDLVSGKVYLRRELWPAQYSLPDINDHVSVYLLRNQSVNQGASFLTGREGIKNTHYLRRSEAIVGTALHLQRSGPSPDSRQGYTLDVFAENSGHFFEATQTFSRAAIDIGTFFPMTAKSQCAVRIKYAGGYPSDKELFFAGGIDGLRGYDRKTIRGANIILGSLEYRFPLLEGLKISMLDNILGLESISGVIFGDVGESWFSAISDAPLRKDVGLGIRFIFNIGSLFEKVMVRADVAQAINDSHEDHPRLWLGINHAF